MRPDSEARVWAAVGLLALAACGGADEDVVARVGDETLTVGEVAEYMQASGYGANEDEVQKAVDEMVDLRLVSLRGRERLELTAGDSLQLNEWRDQLLYNQFRDDVIWKEVVIDEARLREWYEENVGEEVSARHILVGAGPQAPDSVRQAARAKADSLLGLALDGADFAVLAEENSDDTGSAQRGGSLGWFPRGRMVAPFEQAAFAAEPGEVVPQVVETQFGFHVIEVEEKRKRPFEELREEIEDQLARPERRDAEQAYVTRLMEDSHVEFVESNIDTLIALIDRGPETELTDEQRQLPLATYEGGSFELQEIWNLYRVLPPSNQGMIAGLDQAGMIQALSQLMQRRILLDRARTAETQLDSTRQRQLDERIQQFYAQRLLSDALEKRVEVTDADVRTYYDEHAEFYRDRQYEEVEPQIRQILTAQRMEQAQAADSQRELMAAMADSQARAVEVETFPDRYERVLSDLRERLENPETAVRPAGG
ncbi:MAG TPA: peptidylprolyl isomerase [Gemmatimonadota bacterium]|nr:peptidylprolyl isomerase [Gemmatimonadota bacterium]